MLTFNLKKEWFEKIKNGEKVIEYREYKPYWRERLEKYFKCDLSAMSLRFGNEVRFDGAYYIEFVHGYAPKTDKTKRIIAKVKAIRLVNGLETDLKECKPVYAIRFELIKGGLNG